MFGARWWWGESAYCVQGLGWAFELQFVMQIPNRIDKYVDKKELCQSGGRAAILLS